MKQKLLSLISLALLVCSGAWAGDYVDTYTSLATRADTPSDYYGSGISKIELGENATTGSAIQASSNGATSKFTVSTPTGFTIKTITFNYDGKVSSVTCNDNPSTTINNNTSTKLITYTASSSTTSVEFTFVSTSGNKGKISNLAVTSTNSSTDDYEKITPTGSVSEGAIPFTSSLGDGKLITSLTSFNSASSGNNDINFGNGKGITITSSRAIKAIYCVWYQRVPATDAGWEGFTPVDATSVGSSLGTHSATTNAWTAPNSTTTSVTLKRGEGKTAKMNSIHIFYYPSCTSVAAPTDLTCSAQTSTSLTYTWTKAANAVGYIATLYPDAECAETPEASQVLGNVATVTFSGLAASRTYYCKVQSKGDGSEFCAEGNVTDATSGTTKAKAYTVTAESNNNEWGSAVADDGSLDATETTDVTATPNTGYEFVSWSVSGTGATLSSTTDNPTTLTMGTANATVTATFAAKTYTVTLNNQSATSAGTTSVTTTYNANTNLTSSITCPEKTDYVFMGYYTAANGEGKRLIDGSGAWIASVDGYTDASKNWLNDGDVTLYACWMKYANSVNFQTYVVANIALTETSTTWTPLTSNNYEKSLGGNSALDHSNDLKFQGLKMKNNGDFIKFAVEAGKQVSIVFGSVANNDSKPKLTIDGGAESTIDVPATASDNQEVYYASAATDRLFKIKTANANSMVIKKIFIEDASTTEVSATVGANGYTTFTSPYALDLTDANRPAGLKAYKATRDGSSLTFVALNQTVPAGTGLLLLGEENGPSYVIPVVAGAGSAATSNVMVGVTAATEMKSTADNNYFFVMKKAANAEDPLAFAPLATTNVTVPAGKAFVEVPNGDLTSSHELTFTFEEANGDVTGIAEVSSKKQSNGEYFNLNGQRVDASHKGIVIVNGKKFFNK